MVGCPPEKLGESKCKLFRRQVMQGKALTSSVSKMGLDRFGWSPARARHRCRRVWVGFPKGWHSGHQQATIDRY